MVDRADTSPACGGSSCCAPSGSTLGRATSRGASPPRSLDRCHRIEQVVVPGHAFLMGDQNGDENTGDGETPVHRVVVREFLMDATTVTNEQFAWFVDATGYRTEAEVFGFSAVFHLAVDAPASDVLGPAAGVPWWLGVKNANWRHPGGSRSGIVDRGDHPVVHVSWNDAVAYTVWAGRTLPTEAQWEAAARGGQQGQRFPWGNERERAGTHRYRMNTWQGSFPTSNILGDGYLTTAPVYSFEPNAYGLWQMVGNVWEWCADWWEADYYARSPMGDPTGPTSGTVRVLRGGSHLCHESYCNRYRNAARSSNTPDSSMGNAGFRTVGALPER